MPPKPSHVQSKVAFENYINFHSNQFWCMQLIFRGFLMPSLTKFMPLWTAIAASSLIFACVHFSLQRFMVLVLLGVVFGTLYAESHNLMAAIAAHSLWNMWVFVQFLRDASPGLPVWHYVLCWSILCIILYIIQCCGPKLHKTRVCIESLMTGIIPLTLNYNFPE